MTKRELKEIERREKALPIAILKVEMWNKFIDKMGNKWNVPTPRQNQELEKILNIKV